MVGSRAPQALAAAAGQAQQQPRHTGSRSDRTDAGGSAAQQQQEDLPLAEDDGYVTLEECDLDWGEADVAAGMAPAAPRAAAAAREHARLGDSFYMQTGSCMTALRPGPSQTCRVQPHDIHIICCSVHLSCAEHRLM